LHVLDHVNVRRTERGRVPLALLLVGMSKERPPLQYHHPWLALLCCGQQVVRPLLHPVAADAPSVDNLERVAQTFLQQEWERQHALVLLVARGGRVPDAVHHDGSFIFVSALSLKQGH